MKTNDTFFLNSAFETKSFKKGSKSLKIAGYANTIVKDRAGDVVTAQAWAKGVENYRRNPVLLYQHKHENPIGRVEKITVDKKGIFEYILGGSTNTKLLNIRLFEEPTKKSVYEVQTKEAREKNESNCPLCSIGHDANKDKIWNYKDMDADHVTPWTKGGSTSKDNCQMLCKTHNKAKGNR